MKAIQKGAAALLGFGLLLTGCGSGQGTGNGTPSNDTPATTGTEPTTGAETPTSPDATSDGGGDYGGVTELSLYSAWNKGTPLGDLQDKMIKKFTDETGITVKVSDAVGDNAMEAWEAKVAAGQEDDIIIINPTNRSRDWIKNGAAVDMQPYLEEWGIKDKLRDDALNGWTDTDGKLLGLPYIGFEWPVYWNTKLLKDAGVDKVPTTEDEFLAAAEKLNAKGTPLFVTGGGDWTGQAVFFHTIQAYTSHEEMQKVWTEGGYCDNANVMKGIDYFVKLRNSGVFIKDVEGFMMDQQNQTFFTGKAAAMSGGSWWFEDVPEAMRADVELGGIPVPADAAYKKPMASHGSTSAGFWLSKKGAEKAKAARAFIDMFYEQATADMAVTDTASIVTMKLDPAPEPTNTLLKQAITDLPERVEYVANLDNYVPPAVQAQNPATTAQVYSPGVEAAQICETIDGLY